MNDNERDYQIENEMNLHCVTKKEKQEQVYLK